MANTHKYKCGQILWYANVKIERVQIICNIVNDLDDIDYKVECIDAKEIEVANESLLFETYEDARELILFKTKMREHIYKNRIKTKEDLMEFIFSRDISGTTPESIAIRNAAKEKVKEFFNIEIDFE